MKRYVILTASLVIQVCLGGVYAWSVFVPWLVDDYGLTTTQTQGVFGTTIAVFTAVMVYSGRLVERRGPRLLAVIAGVLFAAGYGLAALSGAHVVGLLLGVGVLAGAGIGMGYVCPLTTCIKWFPDHKGLITGVTVAGFGIGAIVLSTLAQLLAATGVPVPTMLLLIGLVYGSAIAGAGLLLSVPSHVVAKRPASLEPGRVIREPLFWGLTVGMFSGTFAGLMVIGNLKPLGLAEGVDVAAATGAISAFALGNAAGRITWGWLHDRVGRMVIPASLLTLGATVLTLAIAAGGVAFIAAAAAVGFAFGACFVVYAAEVASHWGIEAVGVVYPLVFLAYGLSGILGPMAGGWLFESTGSYSQAILLAAVLTVGGAAVFLVLRARARRLQLDDDGDLAVGEAE